MKKRTLSLILAGLLLSSALISCSENSNDTETESQAAGGASDSTAATEEENSLEHYDAIDSKDYGGAELNICTREFNPDAIWFSSVIIDDYYGDAFYDSIYDRQLAVADKMNVKINGIDDWTETGIKNSIFAGAGGYDMYFPMIDEIYSYIQQGLALDLNTMNVDTSQPYWNQNAVNEMTFGGKLYYGMATIDFDQFESMAALFYNGQLLEDNGYEKTIYDLYSEGKWTIDEMAAMMELVISDTSGDGQITRDGDIYGLIGFEFGYLPSLYASGFRTFDYNDDTGEVHITFTDEAVMAAGDALRNIYFRENGVDFDSESEDDRAMFKAGKVLFYSRQIGDFKNLRDQEDDYGIVDYPSVDGSTDGACYVSIPYCMMVPSDIKDPEMTATAIELFASYTYDVCLDNYINRSVVGKGTRDQRSAEIVRGMFDRRAFDVGEAIDLSTLKGAWGNAIRKGTYASLKAAAEKGFLKMFIATVENIAED